MKREPVVHRRGSQASPPRSGSRAVERSDRPPPGDHAGTVEDITATESWAIPLVAVQSLTTALVTRPEHLGRALPLLRELARDPRLQVRQRVCDLAGSLAPLAPDGLEELLEILSCDPFAEIREQVTAHLVTLLRRMPPLLRTQTLCEWAVASSAHRRQAIARALPSLPPTAGARTVARHLAGDPTTAVRAAARTASPRLG